MLKSMCSVNSKNQVQQLAIAEWNEQRKIVISSLLSLFVFFFLALQTKLTVKIWNG